MSTFTDRTLVVSGGSRGIGLAIALGAAKRGANVVLLAKTAEPHPKLPGTVHTAVADVEAAGGKGVAVVGDVRKEEDVQRAVDAAVEHFGGIDIVINNASAIATEPTEELSAKKFDLMMDINVRGTFLSDQGRAAAPAEVGERARGDPGAAAEHEPPLARRAPDVHAVEVRDDACCRWAGPPNTPTPASGFPACGRRPISRPRRWPTCADGDVDAARPAARRSWPTRRSRSCPGRPRT